MLDQFLAPLSGGLLQILGFLFVISVVVFIHEMGHFLVARWCGVTVTTFSIGFGHELWHRYDKQGTRWRIAAIPLGGYVKFLDDVNPASQPGTDEREWTDGERAGLFHPKPVWQRAAVVAAGPIANFILAAVVYTLLNIFIGVRTLPPVIDQVLPGTPAQEAGLRPGDVVTAIDGSEIEGFEEVARAVAMRPGRPIEITVSRGGTPLTVTVTPSVKTENDPLGVQVNIGDIGIRHLVPAVVGDLTPGMPAAKAGLVRGDRVTAIDGKPIASFEDLVKTVTPNPGKPLKVDYTRNGVAMSVEIVPQPVKVKNEKGEQQEVGRIGIAQQRSDPRVLPLGKAIGAGLDETWGVMVQTVSGIRDIITGHQPADQVGGPIMMAEVTARVVDLGLEPLLRWTALISANIGLLNLLPIPILDGGHLLFYGIEAIRRKPLSQKVQELGFQVGLAIIGMMMIFVNLNDILRVGKRLFGGG